MLFKLIVLSSLHKMESERSISAVYYLLQGKQSIQTIQDADLFQLNEYYGIYKRLSKARFFDIVDELVAEQYIERRKQEKDYQITITGEKWLQNHGNTLSSLYLNGKKFKQVDDIYFSRLLLLIQVWTNSKKSYFHFIPIIEDDEVERWVKAYFTISKSKINHYLQQLYNELIELLSQLPPLHAEIFVQQFTGFKMVGMTVEQLSVKLQMSKETIHLITINVLHLILHKVTVENEGYVQLRYISEGLIDGKQLTESTKITKKMLSTGQTISEIAKIRQLKINTIYDHIAEIALYDEQFSLLPYVNETAQQQIIQAIEHVQSYKLKDIKMAVREDITYFQIRLVLARLSFEGQKVGS